ncbi:MAG: DNA ligase D [Gemmatimonadota bacterium]|nr:DNA ligase D [Gemmatimonadota bacterium]MDE2870749.1 DNA ligase D [Gemmatimonadota bacterium]
MGPTESDPAPGGTEERSRAGGPDGPGERLARYRAKRSASATDEPFGGGRAGGGHLFVVQKHRATSLHWDLRLEMDGVLVSWAVPKGPSPNQADKRLAVHVEDHPLEYADFEGVIPEGSYGAGPSIVWDRGLWTAVEDPREGMKKGKLLFELKGYKLRGRWTLVKTKGGADNHWLLIKERDAYEDPEGGTGSYADDSILSGLTVEELGAGGDFGAGIRERARTAGAARAAVTADAVRVMNAEPCEAPFSRAGWVFEIKYDGYRLLGEAGGGKARLVSRNGNDLTRVFPEVALALGRLPYRTLVLDGEVVVNDAAGFPSFRRIQKRGRLLRHGDIARAAVSLPATYYAFDILAFEGYDLRGLPLLERKALLRRVLPSTGPLRYSDHIPEQGEAMFRHIAGLGLEGVVAKRADSPYVGGRSRRWLKIRILHTADLAIHGFTEPDAGRSGFGALHLAFREDGAFTYAGRVGTGFSSGLLEELGERLRGLPPAAPPAGAEAAGSGRHCWVAPELVAEVRYKEITEAGVLRHPSFLRLREDKPPEDCRPPGAGRRLAEPGGSVRTEPERVVHFTNLDKPFWPGDGYVKGDLVDYYRAVAPCILPYLADRPLVLTRFPDGIHGKSFFQKNAPDFAPPWIRRIRLYSEGSERDLDYFVVDDLESLLYVANSGSIPLHIWQSRVADISRPDFCVLDLDPKGAPFADVVRIALFLRELCDEIGLPSFVKTSGSTGLHVLVPLGRQVTYEQSRNLGHLLALVAVQELDRIATVARLPSQREGKVYVDFLQNGHGRLIVAPYCVRPLPGAPVSAPLAWAEVGGGLSIADYTIKTVPDRMARREDPMCGVLRAQPDLARGLRRLAALIPIEPGRESATDPEDRSGG